MIVIKFQFHRVHKYVTMTQFIQTLIISGNYLIYSYKDISKTSTFHLDRERRDPRYM